MRSCCLGLKCQASVAYCLTGTHAPSEKVNTVDRHMGICTSRDDVRLVAHQDWAAMFTLIPTLVIPERAVYRIQRSVEFCVTPRTVVQENSRIEYTVLKIGVPGWAAHVMTLSSFFFDKHLGTGLKVTHNIEGTTVAVASLAWDDSTDPRSPLWRVYSLERPYYGAQPVVPHFEKKRLFGFATVREPDDIIVSVCQGGGEAHEPSLIGSYGGIGPEPEAVTPVMRDKSPRLRLLTAEGCEADENAAEEPWPHCTATYVFKDPGLFSPIDTVVHDHDEDGNICGSDRVPAFAFADFETNNQTGKRNKTYDVEVAPGADAALIVLGIVIKDWDVGHIPGFDDLLG